MEDRKFYAQVVKDDGKNIERVLAERFYNIIEALTASLGEDGSFVGIYEIQEDGTSQWVCDLDSDGSIRG